MISSEVELQAQRVQTDAFIQADPVQIKLWRQPRISNGSGGFTLGPAVAQPIQTFKMIPQNRQLDDRQTLDGQIVRPDNVLLGYYDANIQRGDWFTNANGQRFDVVYVAEKTDYETRAELIYRG